MKTKLLFFTVILCLLSSCKQDIQEEPKTDSFEQNVLGLWELTSLNAMGQDVTSLATTSMPCLLENTIELKSDKNFTYTNPCSSENAVQTGTYSFSKPNVTLTLDTTVYNFMMNESAMTTTIEISPSELGIELPIDKVNVICTFTKKTN